MLPDSLVQLILEYYGTDEQNYIRRGLRYMFLISPSYFSWGSDRNETLHIFLMYYENRNAKSFIEHLLKGTNWKEAESIWATESELRQILSHLTVNVKTCSKFNCKSVRIAPLQDANRSNTGNER